MKAKTKDIFIKAIEIKGKEAQSRQAMEELAELIQAINKRLRYPDEYQYYKNLVEEIGDVEIMLYQLKIMFDVRDEDIQEMIEYKARREEERLRVIENSKEGENK